MLHFRKVLLAVAAVASFIGAGSTANAQNQSNPFVCNTSFSPLVVRAEGLRELLGDIVITCTGGNPVNGTGQVFNSNPVITTGPATGIPNSLELTDTPARNAVPLVNIQVSIPGGRITNRFVNSTITNTGTGVTSNLNSSNLTDALLFIDEPTIATSATNRQSQNPCYATGTNTTGVGISGVCNNMRYFFENGRATGAGYPPVAIPAGSQNLVPPVVPPVIPTFGAGQLLGAPINVYQGQFGNGAPTGFVTNEQSVTFVGVPVVQPGVDQNTSRIFRIKNIRIQVANTFPVNGQILASIAIQNPPANLVLNNSQGVVGFVQTGMTFSTLGATVFPTYAQCIGLNFDTPTAFQGGSTTGTLANNTNAIRFTEGYGVAFKRRGINGPLDVLDPIYNPFYIPNAGQANPTVNYNNESGFYNLAFTGTNNLNIAGIASTGTRLRARFSNLPTVAGFRLAVSAAPITGTFTFDGRLTPSGSQATPPAGTLLQNISNAPNLPVGQLTGALSAAFGVSTDANGLAESNPNPPFTSTFYRAHNFGIQGATAPGPDPYSGVRGSINRTTLLTVGSDGTATYTWEVLRADDNIIDRFDFLVQAQFLSTTSIVTNASSALVARVSGNLAPITVPSVSNFNTATFIPSFILTQPLVEFNLFQINNCATNLLYPYVTSVTGFNTGIAVSNTSQDPFNTINETGICTVNFYGTTDAGGVPPAAQPFTRAVPAGQSAVFNLRFGGPDWGIQPVPGFTGYLIVQCNFRWAHGFAFISDPGNLFTAHGYLALILDPPGLNRSTGNVSEALDN